MPHLPCRGAHDFSVGVKMKNIEKEVYGDIVQWLEIALGTYNWDADQRAAAEESVRRAKNLMEWKYDNYSSKRNNNSSLN
jgi:hypothetical protein